MEQLEYVLRRHHRVQDIQLLIQTLPVQCRAESTVTQRAKGVVIAESVACELIAEINAA
jgi:hypothetical protein